MQMVNTLLESHQGKIALLEFTLIGYMQEIIDVGSSNVVINIYFGFEQ
jgi:hypothetical protein